MKPKMNKKLLNKMSAQAMPEKPKPMMHLSGEDAKQFFGMKPGEKVSAKISGVLQNVGMREWNKNEPTAEIQVTDFACDKGKKG